MDKESFGHLDGVLLLKRRKIYFVSLAYKNNQRASMKIKRNKKCDLEILLEEFFQ